MTDRKELIEVLEHCIKDGCSGCPNHYSDGNAACDDYMHGRIACIPVVMGQNALALLKEQPDIVRCKDCKHYEEESGICDLYHAHGVCRNMVLRRREKAGNK